MEHLKAYLTEHGVKQRTLAELGGWREQTVCDWLAGRYRPSAENMARIERLTHGAVPMASWFEAASQRGAA